VSLDGMICQGLQRVKFRLFLANCEKRNSVDFFAIKFLLVEGEDITENTLK
jgi:hypothetical protein